MDSNCGMQTHADVREKIKPKVRLYSTPPTVSPFPWADNRPATQKIKSSHV